MRLRIESIDGVVIDDTGNGDLADLANGTLVSADSSAPFVGVFVVGTSDPSAAPLVGLELGRLSLDIVVMSAGAGSITFILEDRDYSPGPFAEGVFSVESSGTLAAAEGSSVVVESWVNTSNLMPDLGTSVHPLGTLDPLGAIPAGSLAGFGGAQSFGVGAFVADNSANPINLTFSGQYSLFSRVTVNMTDAGMATLSLSGTIAGEQFTTPEPTTLTMAVIGCMPPTCLSVFRHLSRRRRGRK
jgi:hypothetical protein